MRNFAELNCACPKSIGQGCRTHNRGGYAFSRSIGLNTSRDAAKLGSHVDRSLSIEKLRKRDRLLFRNFSGEEH